MISTYRVSHLCADNVCDTVRSFLSFGLYVHPDKCSLLPKQDVVSLGFVVNSLLMIIFLTPYKAGNLRALCEQVEKYFTIRCIIYNYIANVIGKLIAALPGVEFGRLHCPHVGPCYMNSWDPDILGDAPVPNFSCNSITCKWFHTFHLIDISDSAVLASSCKFIRTWDIFSSSNHETPEMRLKHAICPNYCHSNRSGKYKRWLAA